MVEFKQLCFSVVVLNFLKGYKKCINFELANFPFNFLPNSIASTLVLTLKPRYVVLYDVGYGTFL